ncbi:MAG: hypothetical protein ACOCVA_07610 [Prolixibacteraceae bacterium]
MTRFLLKIAFFWILLIGLIYTAAKIASRNAENKEYHNFNVEDNVIITPKNEHFDFVMLGLSHARNFSRHRNHQRVEEILDRKFLNFGKGGGKGNIANQHVFLKYFLSRGNTTEQIIYVLSMPMFFAERLDENAFTYQYEKLDPLFFYHVLTGPDINKGEKLYTYIRSKSDKHWRFKYGPWSAKMSDNVLEKIDSTVINNGFKLAYVNGLEFDTFEKNKKLMRKTVELAKKNNIGITFIVTPSTFGEWPGHEHVMDFMSELKEKYGSEVYDFSRVYLGQKKYFYDHHHLNSDGVVKFTKEYLKPLMNEQFAESQ